MIRRSKVTHVGATTPSGGLETRIMAPKREGS
jgi:hypothetical protein